MKHEIANCFSKNYKHLFSNCASKRLGYKCHTPFHQARALHLNNASLSDQSCTVACKEH